MLFSHLSCCSASLRSPLGTSAACSLSAHSSYCEESSRASRSNSLSLRQRSRRRFLAAHSSPSSSRCEESRSRVDWTAAMEPEASWWWPDP